MRRTLSWLVAGAMVSGLGVASFAGSQDTLIPLQDPPKMTIGNLYQIFDYQDAENANSTSVNRILPTASQETVRDGFRSNTINPDVSRRNDFPNNIDVYYEAKNSVDFERVAEAEFAPWYRQQVTITTNGPTESIKRVGYCLINSNDDEVYDGDGVFDWYDDTDQEETNDIERNCGFNDDNPTSSGSPDNARAAISMIYDVQTGNFDLQGTSEHEKAEDTSNAKGVGASWDGQTLTVHFAFKPSHALTKASSGWVIRAAAQDLPSAKGVDYAPQVSQIFWGNSEQTENEVTSDEASRSSWKFASVGYYGAIVTARSNVSYGTLRKGGESLVTGITSGRYIANSESELLIHADNFEAEDGSATEYVSSISPGNNKVLFRCKYAENATNLQLTDAIALSASVLHTGLADTLDASTPEDSQELSKISCALKYGGGASNAGEVYQNSVYISIRDSGPLVPPVMD